LANLSKGLLLWENSFEYQMLSGPVRFLVFIFLTSLIGN
jgi:hypothetical protein